MKLNETKLGRWTVFYGDPAEFRDLKTEIWTRGGYYFDPEEEDSEGNWGDGEGRVIVDAGAHMGLASLYWLGIWPRARVWAVEPNEENLRILRENVAVNGLGGQVEAIGAALVGDQAGRRRFYYDRVGEWLMSGSLSEGAWDGSETSQEVWVETRLLSEILEAARTESPRQKIDLLKMDIEGAEGEVLREAREELRWVQRLILEYHPTGAKSQDWGGLIKLLEKAGFTLTFYDQKNDLLSPAQAAQTATAKKLVMIWGSRA